MEEIKAFVTINYGLGDGDGSGPGFGYGNGYGWGFGVSAGSAYGDGYGCGFGVSVGDGSGYSYGSGYGYGYGSGSSYGSGSGDVSSAGFDQGSGYGTGYGYGLASINGQCIYLLDGVQTLIYKIVKGIAKGAILNSDLTLVPCYIMRHGNMFAHGETIHKAQEALQHKLFDNMSADERIDMFLETFNLTDKYSGRLFYDWHNKLTGSCEMGRKNFIADHDLDIDAEYTVQEFISICENAFGSNIIKQLKDTIDKKEI